MKTQPTPKELLTHLEELYLQYVNDFLTMGSFAEHYDISPQEAQYLIHIGGSINDLRPSKNKDQRLPFQKAGKDYSGMKHIEIHRLKGSESREYSEGDVIASIEENSFGDQIVHFSVFRSEGGSRVGFYPMGIETNHEGNHMSVADMKTWLARYKGKE